MRKLKNIEISSNKVLLSQSNENYLDVKFIICDFNINKNNVGLDRNTIEEWLPSIIGMPVVGKIEVSHNGLPDFTGHNVKIVSRVDENGDSYSDIEFDTSAFGSFVSVGIERLDDGKEYIVANAKIWKRFKNASELVLSRLMDGNLFTSWEIAIKKFRQEIKNGTIAKIIESGEFIGHALLGNDVEPAYDSSKILQVAEKDDRDLSNNLVYELLQDLILIASEDEMAGEKVLKNKTKKDVEVVEDKMVSEDIENIQTEDIDENKQDNVEVVEKSEDEVNDEPDIVQNEDTVVEESVENKEDELKIIQFKLDTSNEALIKANETIKSLESQIAELIPFKDKFEKAEQEKIEQEQVTKRKKLSEYALKSDLITSEELENNDEIKTMISQLDESGIKAIIAERFMKSLEKKSAKTVEISSVNKDHVSTNINDTTDMETSSFNVSDWLKN